MAHALSINFVQNEVFQILVTDVVNVRQELGENDKGWAIFRRWFVVVIVKAEGRATLPVRAPALQERIGQRLKNQTTYNEIFWFLVIHGVGHEGTRVIGFGQTIDHVLSFA